MKSSFRDAVYSSIHGNEVCKPWSNRCFLNTRQFAQIGLYQYLNEEFKIETVYTLGIVILTTSKEGVIFSYLTIQNTILSLQSVSFTKYFSLYYTYRGLWENGRMNFEKQFANFILPALS